MRKKLLMTLILACSLAITGCSGTTAETPETENEEVADDFSAIIDKL